MHHSVSQFDVNSKKPQPVKNAETHVVGGDQVNPGNHNHLRQDKEPAVMSYSRLSLESEAALAAAANLNGGSVRHLPNGLVTFAPVQQNGMSNGFSNGHVKQNAHNNQQNNQQNRSNNHSNNHRNQQQTHALQVQQNTSYVHAGTASPIMNTSLSHNNNHNHNNSSHNQHPLIRGSNGTANNNNGAVTGSTINVAIRSNNGGMSPGSMSPRYVTSPSPGPPSLPGQHQVMTNGRSIMTTTLEV